MTHKLLGSWFLLLMMTSVGWSQAGTAAANKPVITIALPGADALFEDLKLAFDLAGDTKGFETIKSTMEVFIAGVDPAKPSGVRLYARGDKLPFVLTVPIRTEKNMKDDQKIFKEEFLSNLWDLDLKTVPPPMPIQGPQVPLAKKKEADALKLTKYERMMFNLFDGFVRYEPPTAGRPDGLAHVGQQLADVRATTGPIPADLLKGQDLVVLIDGTEHTPAARKEAFAKAKSEMLGALKKTDGETDAAFALRKGVTEHQLAEVERFFADSSKISLGWTTSNAEKNAKMVLDLSAVPKTSLEQSIEILGKTPDEFAGVGADGTTLRASINFPLDPLRQQAVQSISKLARDDLKTKVAADEKLSNEQKQADRDLVDLIFDTVDGIGSLGTFNGFARIWSNGDGTLTLIGGTKVPDGAGFVKILEKFAERGGGAKVQVKVDTEGDVEIHKLSVGDLQKDYPELLDKDGTLYVGTAEKSVWIASGAGAMDRLKKAIQEAKQKGPQPGPVGEMHATLLPLIEVLDKVRNRQEPAAAPKPAAASKPDAAKPADKKAATKTTEKKDAKKADTKKVDDKPSVQKATGILADLHLRQLALDAFKQGKDTLSLSLERHDNDVQLKLQLDEGIIRFLGKALSKFVKDNLADDN